MSVDAGSWNIQVECSGVLDWVLKFPVLAQLQYLDIWFACISNHIT